MKYLFFTLLISLFSFTCSSQKYSASNLPEKQLVFGHGGGFAGTTEEYILLPNGQLFLKSSMSDTLQALPNIKKKRAKMFFEKAVSLSMDTVAFEHPGNIYYFLNYYDEEGKNRVVWGDMNHTPPPAIKEFYSQLTQLKKEPKE